MWLIIVRYALEETVLMNIFSKDKCASYITNSDGPESCNTNNMLNFGSFF